MCGCRLGDDVLEGCSYMKKANYYLKRNDTMTLKTHRSAGIVLDPVQFAEELTTLKKRPHFQGHALLCELPDAVVRLLENSLVPHGVGMGIAATQNGMPCAVIHVQAASTQAMCIVPLVDEVSRDWFIEAVESRNGLTLAVSVTETQQLALLNSARLVDDPKGRQWRDAKEQFLQARYELEAEARGLDIYKLLLSLEAAPRSVIEGFAIETLHLVVCIPDPLYVPPGRSSAADTMENTASVIH